MGDHGNARAIGSISALTAAWVRRVSSAARSRARPLGGDRNRVPEGDEHRPAPNGAPAAQHAVGPPEGRRHHADALDQPQEAHPLLELAEARPPGRAALGEDHHEPPGRQLVAGVAQGPGVGAAGPQREGPEPEHHRGQRPAGEVLGQGDVLGLAGHAGHAHEHGVEVGQVVGNHEDSSLARDPAPARHPEPDEGKKREVEDQPREEPDRDPDPAARRGPVDPAQPAAHPPGAPSGRSTTIAMPCPPPMQRAATPDGPRGGPSRAPS